MSLSYAMVVMRAALALLVVALAIGLTPMAYADPPDPAWIVGYWDDDDFDNVVIFIGGACALDVSPPAATAPLFEPVARVHPAEAIDPTTHLFVAPSPRAPPSQPRTHC